MGYRLDFSLRHREVYLTSPAIPPPYPISDKRKLGVWGRPNLRLRAYSQRVEIHLEYSYESGHMWVVEPECIVALVPHLSEGAPDVRQIAEHLPSPVVRELAESVESWDHSPVTTFGLFQPRAGASPDRVEPPGATHFELGRSSTFDNKVPNLTLRLGRNELQIVLDHHFAFPERLRRFEVLHSAAVAGPQDIQSRVREEFGPEVDECARWFYNCPEAHFTAK